MTARKEVDRQCVVELVRARGLILVCRLQTVVPVGDVRHLALPVGVPLPDGRKCNIHGVR